MPRRYDPPGIHVLGDRWEFALTINDAAGTPKDLTGATVTVALGKASPVSADAALADQVASPGQASAVFLPDDTTGITMPTAGLLYYRVTVAFDADNRDTVADGYIRVQR